MFVNSTSKRLLLSRIYMEPLNTRKTNSLSSKRASILIRYFSTQDKQMSSMYIEKE